MSLLGDEVALLAMVFRARLLLGHWGVALILIAGALPLVVLAAPAGLVADRVRAKPLLVTVHLAQGAACAAMAFAPPLALPALALALAIGQSVAAPAWSALIPSLVTPDERPAAFGLQQSLAALAAIAGPFAGGFLVAATGLRAPLLLDAASFAVLSGVALVMAADRRPTFATDAAPAGATDGLRLIAREPVLRAGVVMVVVLMLTLGVVNVADVYFATGTLHAGAAGYGALALCFGVGSLAAGITARRLNRRFRPCVLFAVAGGALALTLLAYGLSRQLPVAAAWLAVLGLANGTLNVAFATMVTAVAGPEILGRVFAAVSGATAAAGIGALAAGGLLLTAWSAPTVIVGGAAVAAATLGVTVWPVLRPVRAPAALAT